MSVISLSGKVALITGASSGIGAGVALKFARSGCDLALTGRNESNLDQVKCQCVAAGLTEDKINDGASERLCSPVPKEADVILCHTGDITDETVRQNLLQKTLQKFGKIDVLVNNAGIMVPSSPNQGVKMGDYDLLMNVNTRSVVALSLLCVPHLKETKGNIVNVSSILGFKPMKDRLFYCMCKASIDMFAKCMALELAASGVRVNNVSPGPVETNIHLRREEGGKQYSREFFDKAASMNPSGRNPTVEEVADAILFLASDQASFITGSITPVDGGIGL